MDWRLAADKTGFIFSTTKKSFSTNILTSEDCLIDVTRYLISKLHLWLKIEQKNKPRLRSSQSQHCLQPHRPVICDENSDIFSQLSLGGLLLEGLDDLDQSPA